MLVKIKILALLILFGGYNLLTGQDANVLYTNYCAGCHGNNLQGTTGTTDLVKEEWTHGGTDESIAETIKNGIPSTTMTAWENILTEDEIQSLVDFIRAAQDSMIQDEVSTEPNRILSQKYELHLERVVTENLEVPWGIEFINADTALISERQGKLRWLVNDEFLSEPIAGTPQTHTLSYTGGYMDIALDPEYDKNGWIYMAFSHTNQDDFDNENAAATTKIVRGKIKENRWVDQQTLFEAPESLWIRDGDRWGCRLLFDEEGRLYFTIGDMARGDDSQDLSKVTGKVFRIHKDGSIPVDNPFVDQEGAIPSIFTIGNRNVQGLDIHPETGLIWSTDHGPQGGDEVNILENGKNYGWPVITYGIDYDGTIISEETQREGMEQPIYMWNPSIAVCPAVFVTGSKFPEWENNLLVGALNFQELRRLTIVENRVIHEEIVFKGLGRIRDLKFGPYGALYVLLNGPDQILKITPVQ